MKDYYYILGIDSKANETQIKSAFRKLSLKFHPDKNDGDIFFEERFKDIQQAYEILSNFEKRNEYDLKYSLQENSNNNTHDNKQYEDILKKRYEAELKKQEEEIKRKYQTPQQRAAEEQENRRTEEEEIKKQTQLKLLNELEQCNKSLSEKDKILSELKAKVNTTEKDIAVLKNNITSIQLKLNNNGKIPKEGDFIIDIKKDLAIIDVLDKIKELVYKEEQLIFFHMLVSYAKTSSIKQELIEKHPHLLKLIQSGKIKYEPLYYVFYKFNKYGKDTKAFEADLLNYLLEKFN